MIIMTSSAAEELKKLMAEKDEDGKNHNPETVGLRIFVQGGGCSGFQYGMQIEDEPKENDSTFQSSGIRIYIDPISVRYLQGATLDFVNALIGAGFIIKNPNAKSTCGCGSSFET
ncbi:MAG: hypothetical protein A3J46_05095 [Candidatus Yanofskybacteria bacterium RIFCSPHIGHO2_02_FULL_41_11]|uniref:Core domain-containing protein n=1 Tax=Candidatus Yanofskybacteria bacterium RIFCSPHIGHO2_02_FULL_41_11 TaxID=1802675 RepID=A0A1F8F7G3_9BACT|nr:MAG: hypothetical protein A3J46_05095 [Candidatus Yanofskybacteria bacterium RIFCSPHIGHO2_02_FULL_41_11]